MRFLRAGSFAGMLFVAGATTAGEPIDYGKLTPPLGKQPAYQSWLGPKYALLVFGKEARLRMWVVLDGETIYLDRNADGDLTGANEKLPLGKCKDLTLAGPDGATRYTVTFIDKNIERGPALTRWFANTSLLISVTVSGTVSYKQYCDVAVRSDWRRPAIAHFNGPLTAGPRTMNWKLPPETQLKTGEKPTDLFICTGTMNADYGCWVVVETHAGEAAAFNKDVRPFVDVQFPGKTAHDPVVRQRYKLEKFC